MNAQLGLPAFDEALAGRSQGHILITSSPGVETTPLLHTIASRQRTVYLSLARSPERVLEHVPDAIVVDGYSALFGGGSGDLIVQPADSPAGLEAALKKAHEQFPEAPLVVEGLAAIMDRDANGQDAIRAVLDMAREFPWSVVHGIIWGPGPVTELLHRGAACNITVETDTQAIVARPLITLDAADAHLGPADVDLDGKPRIHVPKVVIHGEGAMKILESIGSIISTGVVGGHVDYEGAGFVVRLVALPAEDRFASLVPNLARGAVAGIDLDGNHPALDIPWHQASNVMETIQTVVTEAVRRGWK